MTNRLLLDTCAVIWMAQALPLAREATEEIDRAFEEERPIAVSAITAWELGLLGRRGKLPAAVSPYSLFERFVGLGQVGVEPLTPQILIDSSFLPGDFHNDPADRIVVATARTLAMTIVTRDRAILAYAKAGYVRALLC
jgi:PIN domain nuclease of toxin-antitoxin system